jgi:cytoskeletal protein CcmA (bactofilin family)
MALFKKNQLPDQEPAFTLTMPNVRKGTTYLGKNLNINGNINGEDDVQMLGNYNGNVELGGKLEIHESAVVRGIVKAKNILVSGLVEGDLEADEKLMIQNTAKVTGNIKTPVITVHEGAFFEGEVKTNND